VSKLKPEKDLDGTEDSAVKVKELKELPNDLEESEGEQEGSEFTSSDSEMSDSEDKVSLL
jgi:hypothetical protein